MEKVIQYFIQEIKAAEKNPLIKLAVVSALYESFLAKPPSCKVAASTGDMVKCLLGILQEEMGVGGEVGCEKEGEKCNTIIDSRLEGSSLSSIVELQSQSESTVRDLLKLMTLRCIQEFSLDLDNVNHLDVQLTKSVLSFYANICDLEEMRRDTRNFRFSRNFTKCVHKYIAALGWKVKAKVVTDPNEPLKNVKVLKQYLECYGETDEADCICQINESGQFKLLGISVVTDSASSDEEDLVDLLLSQQVAWGRVSKYHNETGKLGLKNDGKEGKKTMSNQHAKVKNAKSKTEVCDLVVRKILNGNLMWVNVGKDSIKAVEQIHFTLELERESNSLEECKYCQQNAIVATLVQRNEVFSSSEGNPPSTMMMIRARILSVIAGIVTVFGIDVGGVYKVPLTSVFCLPANLGISSTPQQVTLAFLYDVSPTPVDLSHMELLVATMGNFCRLQDVSKAFMDLNLLPILPALISCGDFLIAVQAVRLATYVSKHTEVECCKDWCHIMLSALESLNKLVRKHIAAQERAAVSRSTVLSGNESTSSKAADEEEEAVDADTKPRSPSKHSPVGEVSKKEPELPKKSPSGSSPRKRISPKMCKSPTAMNDGNRADEGDRLPDNDVSSGGNGTVANLDTKSRVKDKSDHDDKTLMVCIFKLLANLIHKNQPMKDMLYYQSGLESVLICFKLLGHRRGISPTALRLLYNFVNTYQPGRESLPGRSNRTAFIMGENVDVDDDDDNDDDDYDYDDEIDFDGDNEEDESLEGGFHQDRSSPDSDPGEKESSFLVKDSTYPHVNNPRYEMLEGLDWTSQSLAAIVCGMLNSGRGGTICVGVGKGGEVRGEKVSHDMRDELRLGLDDLMARLVPNVMHFQLQVQFVPVVVSGPAKGQNVGDGKDDSVGSLHVIEIECNPIRGVIHTLKNEKAYYRTGNKTILVGEQDIRHLIVIDEEQKFMDEIIDLQMKLHTLEMSALDETS